VSTAADAAAAAAVAAAADVAAEIPYLRASVVDLNSFDIIHLSVVAVALLGFVAVEYIENIYHPQTFYLVDFVLDPL